VVVDARDPAIGTGHEQLALDELLDGENDAILDAQANGRTSVLDGLPGVLHLEEAAVGRIGAADASLVTASFATGARERPYLLLRS
jgi:hypothetical protein